jgi:hypothetical protein
LRCPTGRGRCVTPGSPSPCCSWRGAPGGAALTRWEPYGNWLEVDANFRAARAEIAAVHARGPDAVVQIHAPFPQIFRFVSVSRADRFWKFFGDVRPIDRTYAMSAQPGDCTPGVVVIDLDERLRYAGTCP